MSKEKKLLKEFIKGVIYKNPIFVMALGLCPLFGVTTNATDGLILGIATMIAIVFSVLAVLTIQKVDSEIKIPLYLIIMAAFVTLEETFMHLYFYDAYTSIGIFIPLIIVNCIILQTTTEEIEIKKIILRLAEAAGTGAGFAGSLLVVGIIREILGNGTLFGRAVFDSNFQPAIIMIMPPGAFLTVGFLIAAINLIKKWKKER